MPLSFAVKKEDVSCGDPVSIVGLFRLHYGKKRNIPIVHSGNVATLADGNERVPLMDRRTREIVEAESYLVEAQTLDGLSGSPVFIHRIVGLDEKGQTGIIAAAKLFGVYQGSWDREPGRILAEDRNLKGGERVPVGMGIVVPIHRALELIEENEQMKKLRDDYKRAKLAGR